MPGGKLLAGNTYFKRRLKRQTESSAEEEGEKLESPPEDNNALGAKNRVMDSDEDEFKKMQQQVARYYLGDNPTIKCRNCK